MKKACPAPDVLAAFASGELPAESKAPIELHVSQCDVCLETIGYLTSRASLSESDAPLHAAFASVDQVIGPYRLLRSIGEGGMGEVWEAQQVAPVRRTVALKLLKPGMDTRQIVARFDAERQVLALMQHPSIAQVFDAGITATGRSYFVMEYVDGVRITSYCDHARLNVRDRLELFKLVCEAVQHAHQKGVIHRDLKPSNVLVTTHGGKALPKVIDFGLAKATTNDAQHTMLTELGTLLGTPAYASPEQLSLGVIDIDTRSDVYSLGALLYELLVGVIPFEVDGAQPLAMMELRRAIREREPARPSTRLSRLGERLTVVARARGLEPQALRKQLRGDLDWIVMKALEKERDRRYASPHELALDIDRFLNHEPLQAGPPTTAYRVRKFVRRHRLGTAFAATLGILVIGFVVVTIVQSRRIATERDRATAEAAKATSINTFLQETLGSADPWQTGKDISIREVLANAANEAGSKFKDQPLIGAAVKNTIGRTYVNLGELDTGERLIREALDIRRARVDEDGADVAGSLHELAEVIHHRGIYAESVTHSQESLTLRRALYGARSAEAAVSLDQLAHGLFLQSEYDDAERAATEALSIREELFGADSAEAADTLLSLATIAGNGRGNLEEALRLSRRAHDINSRVFGDSNLQTAHAANNIGAVYWQLQQNEQALEYYRKSLEVHERVAGPDHPETATSRENVANALARLQRFDESIPLLEKVLAVRRAKAGDDAAITVRTMGNLAAHELQAGHLDRSQAWFDAALPRYAKAYGEDHPDYGSILANYAALMRKKTEPARAEALYRQALAIRLSKLGPEHLSTAKTRFDLAEVLRDRSAYAEAEPLLLQAHEVRSKHLGADHAQTRAVAESLAKLYASWGKPDKAAAFN